MPATLHMYLPLHYYCRLHRLHITTYICKTSNQVGLELSGNMEMYYMNLAATFTLLSSKTTCVSLVWQTYFVSAFMPITLETVYICV